MIHHLNVPKRINDHGCWLPLDLKPKANGYIVIQIDKKRYLLHRLTVAEIEGKDYFDYSWEARHNKGCTKACFNSEHLQSGSHGDNIRDSISHGTNHNVSKLVCPKCNGEYTLMLVACRVNGTRPLRRCRPCFNKNRVAQRKSKKLKQNGNRKLD